MTKNAAMIQEIINNSKEHPTAEQIFLQMKELSGKISLATVYNNLNTLCRQGIIQKLSLGDGPDRYDKCERHDHLICRKCGRLSDIRMQDLTKDIEKCTGTAIESYDLKIYYICEECKSQCEGGTI